MNTSSNIREHLVDVLTENPYRVLALSFAAVMTLGSFLLYLPIATADGLQTSFVDAVFTAVSCVAVTGLSVVDTATHWSLFGKIVMCILIQMGGLGIMTFTTIAAAVLGWRIGLKDRLTLQESMGQKGIRGLVKLALRIVKATLVIEALGAIVYTVQLAPYVGWEYSWLYGISQAISSFCNAGFVFFDNSLPYRMVGDVLFNINTCLLILLGGIGFVVLFDIQSNIRRGFIYMSLHTHIMMAGTMALIIIPFFLILFNEWSNPFTLGNLPWYSKIQGALFSAVTARTAGMATVDFGSMHANTLFLTIILMFIGAGPGSTAGGVKVTTVVLVFLASIAFYRGRTEVNIYERRIPAELIYRSMAIIMASMCIILLMTFTLATIESFDFIRIFFEVTSAFGTVGLTTGITDKLQDTSKWLIIITMYAGRVGMMTLIGSLTLRRRGRSRISYPEGRVLV